MKSDLKAEIIPNRSLGGIILRTPLKILLNDIERTYLLPKEFDYEIPNPGLVVYTFNNGITIDADIRAGKVRQIGSGINYDNDYYGVRVGMKVSDAMNVLPELYYDEAESVIYCKGVEGIEFYLPYEDPT